MKKTTYKSLLAALAALLLAACTQDELMQDNPSATGSRGSLHVTEVTLPEGGMQSRVALEDGSTGVDKRDMPFNVAATGFDIYGDFVTVKYSFGGEAEYSGYLDYTGSEWSFNPSSTTDNQLHTRPNQYTTNGESWANFNMEAYTQFDALFGESGSYTSGVGYVDDFSLNDGALLEYFTAPADWTYDAGRYMANGTTLDARMYLDKLVASTEEGGGITADTDLTSPTLGNFRVALKHAHAMLRLPQSAITTEPLIVDGQEVTPTFKTLWAELSYGTDSKIYIPLTAVGDNYQAIVPVKEGEAAVTLTGFQMVYTDGEEGNTPYTHVFDLGDGAVALAANTRYPLTLTFGPRKTEVTLTAPTGKPGWSNDESELSNWLNEGASEVTYTPGTEEAAGTFTISGPNGLQLVNQWMTGNLDDTQYSTLNSVLGWPNLASDRLKQNITLAEDITLPATDLATGEPITVTNGQPSGSNWTPVGTSSSSFTGTIDGNGKTITNLRISSTAYYTGLVGNLGSGTVKNLTLSNAIIHSTEYYTGGIAGTNSGTITACTVSGTVTATRIVGGIVGYNIRTVTACSNTADVSGTYNVGGIAGDNSKTITACSNTADVSGDGMVGGIAGWNKAGTIITACGNTATVEGDEKVGGIAGFNDGTVTACWTSNDANEKDDNGKDATTKDGIGYNHNATIAACYAGEAATINGKVTDMNNAIAVWNTVNTSNTIDKGWQAGTTDYPTLAEISNIADFPTVTQVGNFYQVGEKYYNASCEELPKVGDFIQLGDKYYTAAGVEVTDYTMTDRTFTISGDNATALQLWGAIVNAGNPSLNLTLGANITLPEVADGGSNWTPVGNYTNEYTGTIDGNGKTITGLCISSTSKYTGLVGYMDGGTVKNLTLSNAVIHSTADYTGGIVGRNNEGTITACTVSDTVTGYNNVGGIAGANYNGTVSGCTVSGTVTGSGNDTGGIAGYNIGGTFTACTVSGTVTGSGYHTGGIAGSNNNGTVSGCTVSGTVTGSGYHTGGIAGDNNGIITACSNTATVSGDENVGGIAGFNNGSATACSNTATVSGDKNVGGIAGWNDGSVTACWTIKTNENDGSEVKDNKNGIGYESGNYTIAACYVGDAATINEKVTDMNNAITSWNGTEGNTAITWNWQAGTGTNDWPTLVSTAGTE